MGSVEGTTDRNYVRRVRLIVMDWVLLHRREFRYSFAKTIEAAIAACRANVINRLSNAVSKHLRVSVFR